MLTDKMKAALLAADFERCVLNDVPLSTVQGLLNRGLVTRDWLAGKGTSTASGRFPHFNGVKLTQDGIDVARGLQRQARAKSVA